MSIGKLMAGRLYIMPLIMVTGMLSSTCYRKELMSM